MLKRTSYSEVPFVVDRAIFVCCSYAFKQVDSGDSGVVNNVLDYKPDIVITGSSRAARQYDPKIFEETTNFSVFNAGLNGHGLPYIYGLCSLLYNSYKPKLVMIEMEPHFLIKKYSDRYSKRFPSAMAPYMDRSDVIQEMIYSLSSFQWIKYSSYSYRYNRWPLQLIKGVLSSKDTSSYGFVPIYKEMDQKMFKQKTLSDNNFKPDSNAVDILKQLILVSKENDVELLFVTSPEWHTAIDQKLYWDGIEFIKDITKKERCPYVIISKEDYPVFKDFHFFADERHLNWKGAEIVSKIVAEHIIKGNYLKKNRSDIASFGD